VKEKEFLSHAREKGGGLLQKKVNLKGEFLHPVRKTWRKGVKKKVGGRKGKRQGVKGEGLP